MGDRNRDDRWDRESAAAAAVAEGERDVADGEHDVTVRYDADDALDDAD